MIKLDKLKKKLSFLENYKLEIIEDFEVSGMRFVTIGIEAKSERARSILISWLLDLVREFEKQGIHITGVRVEKGMLALEGYVGSET